MRKVTDLLPTNLQIESVSVMVPTSVNEVSEDCTRRAIVNLISDVFIPTPRSRKTAPASSVATPGLPQTRFVGVLCFVLYF